MTTSTNAAPTNVLDYWTRDRVCSTEQTRDDLASAIHRLADDRGDVGFARGCRIDSRDVDRDMMAVICLTDAGGLVLAELHYGRGGYYVRSYTRSVAYALARVGREEGRPRRRARATSYEAALDATAHAIAAGAPIYLYDEQEWSSYRDRSRAISALDAFMAAHPSRGLVRRDGQRGGTVGIVGCDAVSYRGALARAARLPAGVTGHREARRGLRARRPGETARALAAEAREGGYQY